ncbi:MAG TPA: CPXCG motif-containing cysteine-rich protein [Solimonas sp.]|nr:CPXCG motif-containing cysteine-rich protein [Solimonas sp.]
MIEETVVTCPCCWESVALQVDLSGGSAHYTEDCPVCCRPWW